MKMQRGMCRTSVGTALLLCAAVFIGCSPKKMPDTSINTSQWVEERRLLARKVVDAVGKAIIEFREESSTQTTLVLDMANLERTIGRTTYRSGVVTIRRKGDQYDLFLFGLGKCIRPQYDLATQSLKILIEPFARGADPFVTKDHGEYKIYMVENHRITWDWDLKPWGGPIPGHPLWPDELELMKSTKEKLKECFRQGDTTMKKNAGGP